MQTTIGIIRDRYLDDFDGASLTLSRIISSRFASIVPGKNKRSIGAVNSNSGRGGSGRGRGHGRHGGRGGNTSGGQMQVQMNGVNVTDVTRNFSSDEWDKSRAVGGHTYVYQRRDLLSDNNGWRSGRGDGRDGRGARGGRGGRGHNGGRTNNSTHAKERNIAAVNTTDIVECDAGNSTVSTQSASSTSDRGG